MASAAQNASRILAAAAVILAASAARAQAPADPLVTGSIAVGKPLVMTPEERFPDIAGLRSAAEAYRRGDVTGGDAIAARLFDPTARVAAEWIALRSSGRSLGFERVARFMTANPGLPMRHWLQRRAEDAMIIERLRPDRVLAFFKERRPEGPNGRAALAIALSARDGAGAARLALAAYRDKTLTRDVAELLERSFPERIDAAERILRAHRLILLGNRVEGLRLAEGFGPDHAKLAQALAAAQGKGDSLKPLEAVPPALRGHSSYVLAQAQVLRRQNRLPEALTALLSAPRDPALLAEPEEWWTERRVLTRRLLDLGDFAGAYRIAGEHLGLGPGRRAEAEFHAGWIALRYLGHPQTALAHFEASAAVAELASAKARAAYWRGRALEAGAHDAATPAQAYEAAAAIPATYYGQLAAGRLGREALHLGVTEASALDEAMTLATPAGRLIRLLLDAELRDYAQPLAIDFARVAASASQVDAIADLFVRLGDAPTVLAIGRNATARGFAVEQHAFPTFGVPRYEPLPGSEDRAMVYAIARQESAFNPRAVSQADARGLMQMLPSTAARTASRFKVPFSADRLLSDPAYNAMLGAAHLGELMEETKGSVIMAFASYNAGGHRVREWIEAFGDPRKPETDVVDWVERIPFYETRHYVQKIMENMQAYRARFQDNRSALLIGADMERGRKN
jgi:soluble lytic murein transglycosylase